MGFSIGAFHEKCAESHFAAAAEHSELAKCHQRLANKSTSDYDHATIAKCHEQLADHHADIANEHTRAAKALGTGIDTRDDSSGIEPLRAAAGASFGMLAARDADDLNKLVPTNVQGVLPDVPPSVRLIRRPGGPPVELTPSDTAAIDALGRSSAEIQKAILGP